MEVKKESKFKKFERHWDYKNNPSFVKFASVEAISEEAAVYASLKVHHFL